MMPTFRIDYTATLTGSTEVEAANLEEAEALASTIGWKDSEIESEDIEVKETYEI